MENPFPLEISPKQDSIEKLQLMANVPADYKVTAEEFNKILAALNYMYETFIIPTNTFVYPVVLTAFDEDAETGDRNSINAPFGGALAGYFITADEAPTGSALTVNLKKNGNLITTQPATIPAGSLHSLGVGGGPLFSGEISMSPTDKFTPVISSVGSLTPGKNIIIYYQFIRSS